MAATAGPSQPPVRWALWSAWVSVGGIALSAYMVVDKYSASGRSSCDLSERISCSVIQNSEFASLMGVPVAVLGIVWFAIIAFLAYRLQKCEGSSKGASNGSTFPSIVGSMNEPAALSMAMLAWCVSGAGFIVYLLAAELILGAICPMCTAVHLLVAFLFFTSLQLYARYNPQAHASPFSTFLSSATSLRTLASAARTLRPLLPSLVVLAAVPLVAFVVISGVILPSFDPSHAALRTCVVANRQQLVLFGIDGCAACRRQKELLGNDVLPLVRYIDCAHTPGSCEGRQLKGFPTWAVEDWAGKELSRHYGLRTVSQLLTLASCDNTA